jgi:glycosyltransferase 2 family protein
LNSKIKSFATILIPLLLGAGLTYFTFLGFSESELEQMKSYFVNVNYNYISISLFFAFLGYVFRAYRWKYTLEHVGVKPNFTLNFLAVSVGYFINLSIPRSGEVSRALILKKYNNVPFDKAFGTIIAERIVDVLVLMFFILIAVITEFSKLKNFLLNYIPVTKLIILLIIAIIGLIIGLYLYKYSKIKLILFLKSKIQGLKEGALSVINLPNKFPFLIYTLLIWVTYVLMFYYSTYALNDTNSISFGAVLVAFIIGSLTIAFTNGGFGFFPVLISKILFLYGIPLVAGNAFGWIVWTSQLIITIVLGVLAFILLPTLFRNKKIAI